MGGQTKPNPGSSQDDMIFSLSLFPLFFLPFQGGSYDHIGVASGCLGALYLPTQPIHMWSKCIEWPIHCGLDNHGVGVHTQVMNGGSHKASSPNVCSM